VHRVDVVAVLLALPDLALRETVDELLDRLAVDRGGAAVDRVDLSVDPRELLGELACGLDPAW
jgi:hypothetical protein